MLRSCSVSVPARDQEHAGDAPRAAGRSGYGERTREQWPSSPRTCRAAHPANRHVSETAPAEGENTGGGRTVDVRAGNAALLLCPHAPGVASRRRLIGEVTVDCANPAAKRGLNVEFLRQDRTHQKGRHMVGKPVSHGLGFGNGSLIQHPDGSVEYRPTGKLLPAFRVVVRDISGFSVRKVTRDDKKRLNASSLQQVLRIQGSGTTLAEVAVNYGTAQKIEEWFRKQPDFAGGTEVPPLRRSQPASPSRMNSRSWRSSGMPAF